MLRIPPRSLGLAAALLLVAACQVRADARAASRAANAAQDAGLRAIPKIDVHAHYRTDTPELVADARRVERARRARQRHGQRPEDRREVARLPRAPGGASGSLLPRHDVRSLPVQRAGLRRVDDRAAPRRHRRGREGGEGVEGHRHGAEGRPRDVRADRSSALPADLGLPRRAAHPGDGAHRRAAGGVAVRSTTRARTSGITRTTRSTTRTRTPRSRATRRSSRRATGGWRAILG